jgi:putative serine protease PepD
VAQAGSLRLQYSDGSLSEATIVGGDFATDLAVIRAVDETTNRPLTRVGASERCGSASRWSRWVRRWG